MVGTYRRALGAAELERRITRRSDINPKDPSLDQAIDLAELHARDPSRFRGLIERGTLKRRRAFYLRKVGERLLDGSIRREDADQIGWTKLQIIADRLTPADARRLMRLARQTPANELKHAVRDEEREPARRCVLMYFTSAQYDELSEALKEAGAVVTPQGLAGKEEAIMSIVAARRPRQRRARRDAS